MRYNQEIMTNLKPYKILSDTMMKEENVVIINKQEYNEASEDKKALYQPQWQEWKSGWVDCKERQHEVNGHVRLVYRLKSSAISPLADTGKSKYGYESVTYPIKEGVIDTGKGVGESNKLIAARALFMAQYWGRSVLMDDRYPDMPLDVTEARMGWNNIHLLLRSIEQLTDEEAIKLAAIVIENPFTRYRNIEVKRNYAITGFPYISVSHKNVRYRFEIDCTHVNFSVIDMDNTLASEFDAKPYACIDYLRAIGILLPFTYLNELNQPITLTPAELIAKGWVKL